MRSILTSTSGLRIGAGTVVIGALLDRRQEELADSTLQSQGHALALINLLLIGPFVFDIVRKSFVVKHATSTVFETAKLVVVHSGLYALAHRAMHRVPPLRPLHRFHHKFQTTVMPSSANAVSHGEFIFAYMLPFVVGAKMTCPSEGSLAAAACIVSACNLLVHTPSLRRVRWPAFLVSPEKHLMHHSDRRRVYSAPTIDWEYMASALGCHRLGPERSRSVRE